MSEKKTWSVAIPITGVIYTEVDAETEEEAIEAAMNQEHTVDDIAEWEKHEHVTRGNVFYGHTCDANAEEAR